MDQNQIYDMQAIEVMRLSLTINSNVIDVGCHAGVMLDEILKFSPNGFHFGFEPLPNLYDVLKKKFRGMSKVEIRNSALSEASGVVTFQHVTTNPGYSGLKQRRYDRPNEIIKEIQVKTERMDDAIPEEMPITLIKIDVEGAELQVLKGGIRTIKKSQPVIIFEHGLGAADYYGTNPEQVFDLLVDDCGLRCFTMKDWLQSGGSLSLTRDQFCDEFRSGRNYYFLAAK